MKARYIDLMDRVLDSYSEEHILRYLSEVKERGLTEHGFPRLAANIGILISKGKRAALVPIFTEMMEICCSCMPRVKAANDFSVRELICALRELEGCPLISEEDILRWRGYLSSIVPTDCYTMFAKTPDDTVKNWALFSAVSEFYRHRALGSDTLDFVEMNVAQQLRWLDCNGMYMDKENSSVRHPMVYDIVPRYLFSLLLDSGYAGEYRGRIDAALKKAALLTLDMLSPVGEIPYGGRSNQFLHNEASLLVICEYEAKRYAKEKNFALAGRFLDARDRALGSLEYWLAQDGVGHVKNRFPIESGYGCEEYAYFDKYMITVASALYAAYSVCDGTIAAHRSVTEDCSATVTSEHFHKLFLRSGEYGLEADTNGDPHYDASGVGRLHRKGAPSAICLSVPCPASPSYRVDVPQPSALTLCVALPCGDGWLLGADSGEYRVLSYGTESGIAKAVLVCTFADGRCVTEEYSLDSTGLTLRLSGDGLIGYALPAFDFDGAEHSEICKDGSILTVTYGGWQCRYRASSDIVDLHRTCANRNGHYRTYLAKGEGELSVRVDIVEK